MIRKLHIILFFVLFICTIVPLFAQEYSLGFLRYLPPAPPSSVRGMAIVRTICATNTIFTSIVTETMFSNIGRPPLALYSSGQRGNTAGKVLIGSSIGGWALSGISLIVGGVLLMMDSPGAFPSFIVGGILGVLSTGVFVIGIIVE